MKVSHPVVKYKVNLGTEINARHNLLMRNLESGAHLNKKQTNFTTQPHITELPSTFADAVPNTNSSPNADSFTDANVPVI